MSYIHDILEYNKQFVTGKGYLAYATSRYPDKKIAILSCMDTRLTALLPAAMNLKNGDVKIIQNAGAVISHPFGSIVRSLMVSIYELGVKEILVVGHYDCGMQGIDADCLIQKMLARGIPQANIDMIKFCGIDLKKWLQGFEDVKTSVCSTVETIIKHPLIPKDIEVHGLIIDPETGRLDMVTN